MTARPNVLLITTDHWPAGLLGAAGHPAVHTPTLDRIAAEGVRFTRAYSESPVCIPARRSLMTGVPPRGHGDRTFQPSLPMPDLTSLASAFTGAGYQAHAVGKLHVYPQRDRIGFDDVLLAEEGRANLGATDDYEMFLGDHGHVGQQFAHGMSNNDYVARPWHLPERLHPTYWAAEQMSRTIRRRDPKRPGFWYLSFQHPHPPLTPPQAYLDMYRDVDPPLPVHGEWARSEDAFPPPIAAIRDRRSAPNDQAVSATLRAFYALCTHIDHQLRRVLGTLREEGILENTIIMFTSDHGDMLGDHGLWAKRTFYEGSTAVPMLLLGPSHDPRFGLDATDNRLVGLQDVMPTLLKAAAIDVPGSVTGLPMFGARRRAHLYGEFGENTAATRMVIDGRFKLIYYPSGNRVQLFDLEADPKELLDLASDPEHESKRAELEDLLIAEAYGRDLEWIDNRQLIGFPDEPFALNTNRDMFGVRGVHWPPAPLEDDPSRVLGS